MRITIVANIGNFNIAAPKQSDELHDIVDTLIQLAHQNINPGN